MRSPEANHIEGGRTHTHTEGMICAKNSNSSHRRLTEISSSKIDRMLEGRKCVQIQIKKSYF